MGAEGRGGGRADNLQAAIWERVQGRAKGGDPAHVAGTDAATPTLPPMAVAAGCGCGWVMHQQPMQIQWMNQGVIRSTCRTAHVAWPQRGVRTFADQC